MVVDTLRFVVGSDGKPTAIQMDIETWRKIVEALEDSEDVSLAREALAELKAAGGDPDKAGWLRLEDVAKEWGEIVAFATGRLARGVCAGPRVGSHVRSSGT